MDINSYSAIQSSLENEASVVPLGEAGYYNQPIGRVIEISGSASQIV